MRKDNLGREQSKVQINRFALQLNFRCGDYYHYREAPQKKINIYKASLQHPERRLILGETGIKIIYLLNQGFDERKKEDITLFIFYLMITLSFFASSHDHQCHLKKKKVFFYNFLWPLSYWHTSDFIISRKILRHFNLQSCTCLYIFNYCPSFLLRHINYHNRSIYLLVNLSKYQFLKFFQFHDYTIVMSHCWLCFLISHFFPVSSFEPLSFVSRTPEVILQFSFYTVINVIYISF